MIIYRLKLNDPRSLVVECPDDEFHQFRHSKGFQFISEGIRCPCRKIPMVMLTAERSSLKTIPDEYYDPDNQGKLLDGYRVYYQENAIPRADRQAVKEVSEMLNAIIKKIAILQADGSDCKEELDKLRLEKVTLRNYLKEIYVPKMNKIKCFPTESERINRAAYMAVKRAIKKVDEKIPDLADILDEAIYCWQYLLYTPGTNVEIEFHDCTRPCNYKGYSL